MTDHPIHITITDSTIIFGDPALVHEEEAETFTAMTGAGQVVWTTAVDIDPYEWEDEDDEDEATAALRAELAQARREITRLNAEVAERVRGYKWMVAKADRLTRQCGASADAALELVEDLNEAHATTASLRSRLAEETEQVEYLGKLANQRGEIILSFVRAITDWDEATNGAPKLNAYRRLMRLAAGNAAVR